MKEIIKIQVDDELAMTEVVLRVPGFQNFGQRLGELERKSAEAAEMDESELEGILAKANALLDARMKALPDSPHKEMILKMIKETDAAARISDQEEDPDDAEANAAEPEHDLEQLFVSIPEGMKWNEAAEDRVDQFLASWPEVRPEVLKAISRYYKKHYAGLMRDR